MFNTIKLQHLHKNIVLQKKLYIYKKKIIILQEWSKCVTLHELSRKLLERN